MVPIDAPMRHPEGVRGGRGVPTALWAVFVVVAVVSGWVAVQMVGAAIAPASVSVLSAGEVSPTAGTIVSLHVGTEPCGGRLQPTNSDTVTGCLPVTVSVRVVPPSP